MLLGLISIFCLRFSGNLAKLEANFVGVFSNSSYVNNHSEQIASIKSTEIEKLKSENNTLKKLINSKSSYKNFEISEVLSSFNIYQAKKEIVISASRSGEIKRGDIVINADETLVGRVDSLGDSTARVVLVEDKQSIMTAYSEITGLSGIVSSEFQGLVFETFGSKLPKKGEKIMFLDDRYGKIAIGFVGESLAKDSNSGAGRFSVVRPNSVKQSEFVMVLK